MTKNFFCSRLLLVQRFFEISKRKTKMLVLMDWLNISLLKVLTERRATIHWPLPMDLAHSQYLFHIKDRFVNFYLNFYFHEIKTCKLHHWCLKSNAFVNFKYLFVVIGTIVFMLSSMLENLRSFWESFCNLASFSWEVRETVCLKTE